MQQSRSAAIFCLGFSSALFLVGITGIAVMVATRDDAKITVVRSSCSAVAWHSDDAFARSPVDPVTQCRQASEAGMSLAACERIIADEHLSWGRACLAYHHYVRYLDLVPTADDRGEVERIITTLVQDRRSEMSACRFPVPWR